MDEKTIFTDDGIAIPWFERDTKVFLDYTTFIFGGTGSGKTTIIEEILWYIKDECPNFLVICPSTSMKAYKNKVPRRCMKEDLSKELLIRIWERQFHLTQIYEIANDLDTIWRVFNKRPSREAKVMIMAIETSASQHISKIQKSNMDFSQKKAQINKIEELLIKRKIKIIKDFIKKHKETLLTLNLDKKERVAVEYVTLNPKLCLIIDDRTEQLDGWMKYFKKGESNILNQILFRGRHNNITLIIAAHDDKFIPTELRKNARITYFTQATALQASLNKTGSGYSGKTKKRIELMGDNIFDDEDAKIRTFRTFVIIKNDTKPYRYTIANVYPEMKLGSDKLYELANKLPKKKDTLDDNPYLEQLGGSAKKKKKFPNFTKSKGRHKFS